MIRHPGARAAIGPRPAGPSQQAIPAQRAWPARVGEVPPLAAAFSPRPETGPGLAELRAGQTIVLASAPDPGGAARPAAGGEGKTQLAAAMARSLWQAGAVDLLVWLPAARRDAVVAGYAQALAAVGAGKPRGDADTLAARFLAWLASTTHPWLVVLDDLADPADLTGLLPAGQGGSTVITTRLEPAALAGQNRQLIPVGPFSRREALGYLTAALQEYPDQRIEALDLAEDLHCLPLALAQAAAVISDRGLDCRGYRARFAEQRIRRAQPDDEDPEVTELILAVSLGYLDQLPPPGRARGLLALCCLLDPAGIPASVLTSPAAAAFLTGQPDVDPQAGAELTRTALASLARLGLITVDSGSAERTVRVHPVTSALIRSLLPPAVSREAARAAADALAEAWPAAEPAPPLTLALRDNTACLLAWAGDLLWAPQAHPVLLRAGDSLDASPLTGPAVPFWEAMIEASDRLLGAADAQSLDARDRLAAALERAGRPAAAIANRRLTLAERERLLGPGHPDSLTARAQLASVYLAAGQTAEAIPLYEQALAGREWALGPTHPDTLAARHDLAAAYSAAGRLADATSIFERSLADQEKALGPDHPDTLTARTSLAAAYRSAGRLKDAIPLYERALSGRERVLGRDHPDTLAARGSLAYAYRSAGKLKDAIGQYQRNLADRERVLGHGHPDTVASCANLAAAFYLARRLKDAIPLYERTLADSERVHGQDHAETLTARGNLATAYQSARRLAESVTLYERTLADYERVHGPDHPDTLTVRCNLASAYYSARRGTDAVATFERTLADCERVLGAGHPLTETVRESLAATAGA